MKKEVRHPDKQSHTGSYSAGVIAGDFLYISGQGPLDLATGQVVRGTIEEETLLTLSHIKKIIEAAGASTDNIVKCTVHLKDINDFDRYDKAYASFFSGVLPARTTVQSVLWDGIKVEIDAIVYLK
ncbi:RidA family protein [Flavihumibacter profundi]|uniref:RidA family protein n=1 Tax=Flavihumibacter profundi TaxID=2716883 RepID=UPI001CC74A0D|nr:Rid family hydrolase [Flavihumibacter profundi]MBZ5856868.1 RidA family protein [Flavihumibacter profundi]